MPNRKSYNKRVISKQVLRAREHSRNDLLERKKPQMSEQKLTFNIIFYPAFQNVRTIMKELHILSILNKEHKKVFPNVLVIGFRNGKGVKHFLFRATLIELNVGGRCEPCGKKTCLVCGSTEYFYDLYNRSLPGNF